MEGCKMTDERISYHRENTTFPIFMHRFRRENGELTMITVDEYDKLIEWFFAVEERIEALEKRPKVAVRP
jgi:hypothetical protein